jgi:outer membrane protein assembly factor BamB
MNRTLPLLALLVGTVVAAAGDWSNWRGPELNGISRERGLPSKFIANPKAQDSNVLWRAPSGGISTPIVQNGQVYIINKTGKDETQQERVQCFDADTGELKWEHKFNVFLTDIVADRLGWTHMCGDPETGNVYAHGTQGFLMCFSKEGKILWQHSLTEEFGRVSGYGGRLVSPAVDGDLVIVSMLNASWGELTVGGTRLVAFDKRTGAVVWWGTSGYRPVDTYYSAPTVAVINGERLVLSGGGDGGIHAFKVRTGEKVWSYIFGGGAVNVTPVVEGNYVYIGHGEENDNTTQGRVICLDAGTIEKGQPKLVWQKDGIKAKFASPILHEGRLYIPNEVGILFCLDAKTGDELWHYQYGKNTKGSPVWADGKIYITEVDSRFHILEPGDKDCKELANVFFRSRDGVAVELNGSPAIANDRIYFLTTTDLWCIGTKKPRTESDTVRAGPREEPPSKDAKPAWIQVLPADVAVNPGAEVEFKAMAFDEMGRALGEVEAEWSLAGQLPPVYPIGLTPPKTSTPPAAPPPLQGELSEKNGKATKLTVGKPPMARPNQFGRVVAKVGDREGYARVRVAAALPFNADFSKVPEGRAPSGWVNTAGKYAVAKLPDGAVVLRKLNVNPSPLVSRAHAYIGLPTLTDYTIEADVQGSKAREDMPDIGIDANRYTLMLAGNTQQLRLVSWDALPRIDKTIAFPWEPGKWYSMKLTVKVEGEKALVRGKVWPRDAGEPKEWTVEVEDSVGNKEGAPALYAYSAGILGPDQPGTEIYFTNVKITPNK